MPNYMETYRNKDKKPYDNILKTRLSLADSCCLAMLERFDPFSQKWIKGNGLPTLFITTELEMEEVQTMVIAYTAGVDEDKILDGNYTPEEEERMKKAVEIVKKSPLWIEHIPNFNIEDIERTIKRYVLKHDTRYIFFDYVHSSLKLLEEIASQSKGMKLREDNVLLMFVDRLKNMCNSLNVFIFTATQVNGDWKNVKDADQNILRGSKAIADKLDVGVIALNPTNLDLKALKPILEQEFLPEPNMVWHIYKNRRGKLVGVKLWQYVDLSTMTVRDLFVTDNNYKIIPIESVDVVLANEEESENKQDLDI